MQPIRFVDTTIRDGDQSLWGWRLRTGMILPIAAEMDQVGFEAIDVDTFAPFKTRVREHREEPWERLRLLSAIITRTPLSMMGGCTVGQFGVSPLSLLDLRCQRQAAHGIKRLTINGLLNDMNFRMPEIVRYCQQAGMQAIVSLTYSVSPKHTDEYYAGKTRDALKLKPDRLYIKDPGGLLTPDRVRTLAPAVKANCNGLAIELHSHCTTGLAPLCYLEAMKLGINILHTGIPPLANGTAQPSIFNIINNARLLGYSTDISEEPLKSIAGHFARVARKEGFPPGSPLEYDWAQYVHQVPGGVISNLRRQLAIIHAEQRLAEVLDEVVQVRRDLGYPIMVTPFSQLVVTQATMNVLLGERYKEVPDEIIQYALGYFGEEAMAGVVPGVQARIVDRPRAPELAAQLGYEPSIEEIRQKLGGPGISDDELMARYVMGGDEELKAMRPAAPVRSYVTASHPLMALIPELLKRKDTRRIQVTKSDWALTIERK